ncbi:hypothetical protein, partial [Puniceibacterium confluentis]|uniref:hypothetical protein n=1 Tax=Puniceibacterium confluentis TaxID=1958944 RepID=UPI003561AD19
GPMHLEHILRQIEPDRDNLRHDRPPLWIIADPPWHIDAVGGRSHHQSHIREIGSEFRARLDPCPKFDISSSMR